MKLLAWLRELLRDKRLDPVPRPQGWNKTLADLHAENRNLSGHEIAWAREYEREQLRTWARFPRDGEVFEATREVSLFYLVNWRGPYSGGGTGVLPAGTKLRVSVYANDPEPIGVYAVPLEEKLFEERLIPEPDRLSSKYGGYSLFINVSQLNREFALVPQ